METKFITITVTKGGVHSTKPTKRRESHALAGFIGKGIWVKALLCLAAALLILDGETVKISKDPFEDCAFTGSSIAEYWEESPVTNDPLIHSINVVTAQEPAAEPVLEPDLAEPEPVLPPEPENSVEILESLDVPTDKKANTGTKTYMSYKALTNKASTQYKMQQDAWTDENGFRRYGDYYMVALGTYYAKSCGETFLITLDSGVSFQAVAGDIKDDKHTDSRHQHRNGNIVEFIVDTKAIPRMCRVMGDMSYTNNFSGRIAAIERIAETETSAENVTV